MVTSHRKEVFLALGISAFLALIFGLCFESRGSRADETALKPSASYGDEETAGNAASMTVSEKQADIAARLKETETAELDAKLAQGLIDLEQAPTADDNEMLRVMANIAEVKLVPQVRLEPETWRLIREQYSGLNDVVSESEAKVDELAREIKERRLKGVRGIDYEFQELKERGPGGGFKLPPIVRYSADEVVVEEILGQERKLVRINPGDDSAFDKLQNRFREDSRLRKNAFARLLYEYKLAR